MEQLKCKNCRAKIDPDEIAFGVVRCKYCGYTFTWLKKSFEQSVMIDLQMGEDELAACDFNRAYAAYKRAADADKSEPEAYFGMALAENKVQYLKDTVKDRLQPICHEVGGRKFSENPNYKKALSLATPEQKIIYESRAQEIDYIQAEFASLAQSGLKYDCFICVKVTKEDGKHTEDSFAAGQLYQKLKEDGYHPFYSEEEIGNRRGADYEAMILYALYTSPCMLLVCFDEEYLKTKWVKNEYTRFVALRADDKEKKEEPKIALVYKNEEPRRLSGALSKVQPVNYDGAYAYSQICDFVSSFAGKTEEVKKRLNRKAIMIAASAVLTVGLVGGGLAMALNKEEENPSIDNLPTEVQYVLSENGELTKITLNGNKNVSVPSEINGTQVLSISANAFAGNTTIEELILPDSLTSIPSHAFKDCVSLKKLQIPERVQTIGEGAFVNCSSLTELVLPSQATFKAEELLSGCSSLTSLTISLNEEMASFGELFGADYFTGGVLTVQKTGSYYLPSVLKTVTITGSELPNSAFYRCSNLTTISLSKQILTIGESTFQGCSSLAEVSISENLIQLGDNAFSGCSALRNISLPQTVEEIGDRAFADCSSLTKAEILSEPTLGETLFTGCSSLTEMVLPFTTQSLVSYFGTDEFDNSVAVQELARALTYYLPSDLAKITTVGGSLVDNAFANCSKLSKITFDSTLSQIGDYAFANCVAVSEVTFNEVQSVGAYAFYNCAGLETLSFATVGEFGENAFEGCDALTKTTVASIDSWIDASFATPTSNPIYYTRELYVNETILSEITPLERVTTIAAYAFYNCESLTKVNLSEKVQTFGESAFYGCTNLNTVNVESIPAWCVASFANLEANPVSVSGNISQNDETLTGVEITTPALSSYAFYGASCLTTITIAETVTTLSQYSLNNLSALETLNFNARELPDFTENNGVFTGVSSESKNLKLTLGENVQRIPAYLLCAVAGEEGYLSCVEFTGAPTLKEVGANAFGVTGLLTELVLPQTVETIAVGALSGCYALQNITLPFVGTNKNGSQMGANLFGAVFGEAEYKNGLSTLQTYGDEENSYIRYYLPSTLTHVTITGGELVDNAFSGCKKLTEISLPSTVTQIPKKAFYDCQMLEKVLGVNNVKSISENAFAQCQAYSRFDGFEKVENIAKYAFRDCSALKSIYLPDSLLTIENGAFSGCKSVEDVSIPFVGGSNQTEASESSLFGYIFGDELFEGATQTQQYFASGNNYAYYFIPDTVAKVQVRGERILYGAFMNCKNIQEIEILDSVTEIGSSAFNGMNGVEKATFPYLFTSSVPWSNLKEVHVTSGTLVNRAFADRSSLQKAIIDEDVAIAEDANYLFYKCSSLTEATLPSSWTRLGGYTFYQCSNLESVNLPEGLIIIEYDAFYGCKKLKNVTLPDTLEEIGAYFMYQCTSLESIKIPAKITAIPNYAFSECSALTSVDLTEATQIISIGTSAFEFCSSLPELILPQSVTSIGSSAFSRCLSLTEFTVPELVTSIGSYAFYGCSSLRRTNVPKLVTKVGNSAYEYTEKLEELIWEAESCADMNSYTHKTFCSMGIETENGTTLRFTSSVKRMPGYMFYFGSDQTLPNLTKVIFDENSSMQEFGEYAIYENDIKLEEFRLPDSVFAMDDYASFYVKPKNCYIPNLASWCQSTFGNPTDSNLICFAENLYIEGKLLTASSEIVIPSTVEKISDRAFSGVSTLRKVVLSEGVKEIGVQAFYGTSITHLTIPTSLTNVKNSAFYDLEYSNVNVSIKDLGAWSKINFGNEYANPLRMSNSQLILNGSLVTTLSTDVEEIGSYAFHAYKKLSTINLQEGVKKIGEYAFYNCTGLTNVSLPESTVDLGGGVFSGCSGLKAISLPSGITSLPSNFAKGCSELQTIEFPSSLTSIGSYAFESCTALKKIEFHENITELGAGSFKGLTGLEEIVWSISAITGFTYNSSIFEGAGTGSGVKLTISENVQEIPTYLFNKFGVESSLTVEIKGYGLKEVKSSAFNYSNILSVAVDSLDAWYGIKFADNTANPLWGTAKLLIDGQIITKLNNLEDVTLNPYAFYGYDYLEEISVMESTVVGNYAFNYTNNLTKVYWNTTTLPKSAIFGAGTVNKQLTLTIGKDVVELAKDYANGLTELYEVKFETGSQLTKIGEQAFYGCSSLAKFTPTETLESIGASAFYNCTSLNNITFGEKMIKLSWNVFYGCSSLADITFNAENVDGAVNSTFEGTPYRANSLNQGVFYFYDKILGFDSDKLEENLVIPEGITGKQSVAFSGQTALETVTFPESFVQIVDNMFYNCGLTSVSLSSKLESIGSKSFYGSAFTELTLPDSLTTIGASAFMNCASLARVTLGDGLARIGDSAFEGCSKLENLTFVEGLTNIGARAFYGCSKIAEVVLPESLESIGDYAFSNCGSLATFEVKSNDTEFGSYVFYNTSFLTSAMTDGYLYIGTTLILADSSVAKGDVVVREGTTAIAGSAFYDCYSMKTITLPSSLTKIGKEAFKYCDYLETIYFNGENSIEEIGVSAFDGCSKLKEFALPEGIQKIENRAFISCSSLTSFVIPQSVTELGDYAFAGCTALTEIQFPSNLEIIGEGALRNTGITELTIPTSVTSIKVKAFENNTKLTKANLPNANYLEYANSYGTMQNNAAFSGCTLLADVTIDENVSKLPSSIFYGCTSLKEISLPDSVKEIGASAFYGCTALMDIDFTNITKIGGSAFYNCDGLTEVILPEALTSLGSSVFYDCDGLTVATIPSSINTVPHQTFYSCDKLATVNLSEGLKTIDTYAFTVCAITEISLPSTLTKIADYGFSGNDFTNVTLPEGLTTIGVNGFSDCANLTEIVLPEKVSTISKYAFSGCTNLTEVTMKGVTYIDRYAFYNCSKLTDINFGDKLTTIEGYAFYKCYGLKKLYFPKSLTRIYGDAFESCNSLGGTNSIVFEDPTCWQAYTSLMWRDFDVHASSWQTYLKISDSYGLKKVS